MSLTSLVMIAQLAISHRTVEPVLEFPKPGLDDTASYQGYRTRLFRDAAKNTLQIYLDRREGRVVQLMADADDASIAFSARSGRGTPAPVDWDSPGATVAISGRRRSFRYSLSSDASTLTLGSFLLGSMRVERDFQYEKRHLRPFVGPPFITAELTALLATLEQRSPAVRQRHLALLHASSVEALRVRLAPSFRVTSSAVRWQARLLQLSLDGRDTLSISVSTDPRRVQSEYVGDSLVLSARAGERVRFVVELTTTGGVLSPLGRREIFTPDFLAFLDSTRAAAGRDASATSRAAWMERQVRGVELLASREKLMAGLPTYATYFGRDMLVTALMMRGIWRDDMASFAVASALRKLSPSGEVSHEEALGGQAVREAAAEYVALARAEAGLRARGEASAADSLLRQATEVLRHHRRVRENYHMIDDELQLPVLMAQWLADPNVAAKRKRSFLRASRDGGPTRLTQLLRELALVARMTAPYASSPTTDSLIGFAARDSGWASSSWRDSGAGYASGRFAMDVNAIWAPHALQATRVILGTLPALGFPLDSLARTVPEALGSTPLGRWARDSVAFEQAIDRWMGAGRHFVVRLSPTEVQGQVAARLAAMPAEEREHWRRVLSDTRADQDSLTFLALALDASGRAIGVANTDVATRLFLGDPRRGAMDRGIVLRDTRLFVRAYPVGLFVEGVGPVVANDAFAPPSVWGAFERDAYHGPRVAWGREVNLFLLGVAAQVAATRGADTALAQELRGTVRQVQSAVEASGFRSELWSYTFTAGRPVPVRYGSGGDVQLWSMTDLAVQYALSRLRW